MRVPAFLKEPLEAAQERLEQFEEEAQRLFRELMDKGRASRKDLEQMVARLSRQDWTLPELRHRLERLRDQGVERAAGLRGKAETWRTEAMEKLSELQARAAAFLGVASRDEVQELSREIDRLAKRIGKGAKPRRKKAARPAAEV
jgi:DNA repair exonuclease SbcCD ATPase subunit